jgi:hypothetical protein
VVLARVVVGRLDLDEVAVGVLAGLLVLLVLDGEVLPPHGRVIGRVGQLNDLGEGGLRLLLVLEDRGQQPGQCRRPDGDDDEDGDRHPPLARPDPPGTTPALPAPPGTASALLGVVGVVGVLDVVEVL